MLKIGYFNPHPYPVQFTLKSGRSAPIGLDSQQPITNGKPGKDFGHLIVPPQEELDEEVALGTIAYIDAHNPKHAHFLDFNKKADQRNSGTHAAPDSAHDIAKRPNPARKPVIAEAAPDVTVSAAHAPVETEELEEAEQQLRDANPNPEAEIRPGESLDQWMERQKAAGHLTVDGGNGIHYQGRRYNGKKALAKMLEIQAGGALRPTAATV